MQALTIASDLDVPADRLADSILTMAGVNYELAPVLRMTYPKGADRLDGGDVPVGILLFRSWVLLFGLLPIDWSDVKLERFDGRRGFSERSTMLNHRVWDHERTIEPLPDGRARLTDRLRFEARWPGSAPILTAIVRWVFARRHRRLRARHGGAAAAA